MGQNLIDKKAPNAVPNKAGATPNVKARWAAYSAWPVSKMQLAREIGKIRRTVRRSAFFPVVVVLGLIALIYNSGQLRALAVALTAPLSPSDGHDGGGFGAGSFDVLLWLLSCCVLVWAWFLYFVDPDKPAQTRPPAIEIAVMHWILPLLVLAPFFVAQVILWNPTALLFLAQAGPLYMILSWLGGWRNWTALFLLVVATENMLHQVQLPGDGYIFVFFAALCLIAITWLLWRRPGTRTLWRDIGALYCFSAALATAVSPILAYGLLPNLAQPPDALVPPRVVLALWWIAPGMIVNVISIVPVRLRRQGSAVAILLFGTLACFSIAWLQIGVFGLTTLCLVAAMMLAVGSLLRMKSVRVWRHLAAYGMVVVVVGACWNLSPQPTRGKLPAAQRLGESRVSDFDRFYQQWLAARGETAQHHGPLLLVAVAGGGVRAAAHATLALSAADDAFKGKFGDRTLAISGVSGGALGAATWIGQRLERLPPAADGGHPAPTALRLSRFYQRDFVSPTLNRLLVHDLPLGMLPWIQASDRDEVLARTWASSWDDLRREAKADTVTATIFRRSVASLGSDPRLPVTIFNATSAADGRPAVYSSIAATYPGAWMLDPSASVMDAVADSARFAVVTPVGHACARRETVKPLHSASTPVTCNVGFDPIAVADGGYIDNSGLASLETILDELKRHDASMENVYVVIIRSNPEIGLHLTEGQRFDMGRTIPELFAPLSVLDTARGARSDLLAESLERRLGKGQVMTWDLTLAQAASAGTADQDDQPTTEPSIVSWFKKHQRDAEAMRRLQLAPLGWTLDRNTFSALAFDARMAPQLPRTMGCKNMLPQYAVLCENLPNANSPRP
jgi:hypothetical protein